AEVHWRPQSGISKKRMHVKLMKAWFLMRLLTRLAETKGSRSHLQLRLSAPVEHVIQANWPQLQTHLRNFLRRRAEIDGEVSKVVIDGHQKLTRKCCGLMYGGYTCDPNLGKARLHPCPAPTRGQRERWCTCRARSLEKPVPFEGAKDADAFLVRRRECLGGTLDDVLCVTSQRQGVGAVRVVDDIEGCWDAVQSTLARRAADAAKDAAESRASEGAPDKLKAKLPRFRLRKRKAPLGPPVARPGPPADEAPQEFAFAAPVQSLPARPERKRRLPAGLRTYASCGDGARPSASRGDGSAGRAAHATAAQPAQPVDPAAALPAVDASLRELEQISCKTHKSFAKGGKRGKLESASLAVRRTGGFLVACSPSGHIIDVEEFFGVESLAQRYCFLARLKKRFPALNVVIHDDACHLPQYSTKRKDQSALAALLAHPRVVYVVGRFHARGHVDPWCKQHCCPDAPGVKELVDGANTSICEITFSWAARYLVAFGCPAIS
ncbi:unnamed protein product, partial [Prorocentrum cordatum]